MSISGLVVQTRPESVSAVAEAISAMSGVEVHASSPDGRLVVTVDEPDNKEASTKLVALQNLEGVINASLVYNYFEEDSAEEEEEAS